MKNIILLLLLSFALCLQAQVGTTISLSTLSLDGMDEQNDYSFDFDELLDGKNNYSSGANSIAWNTVQERWEVSIGGTLLFSSNFNSSNPPSDESVWFEESLDQSLLTIDGDGTLTNECLGESLFLNLGDCGSGFLCLEDGVFSGFFNGAGYEVGFSTDDQQWQIVHRDELANPSTLFISSVVTMPYPPSLAVGNWQEEENSAQSCTETLVVLSGSVFSEGVIINSIIENTEICSSSETGEFTVMAECFNCSEILEYSVNDGETWVTESSFSEQTISEEITVKVRKEDDNTSIYTGTITLSGGTITCGCTDETSVNYNPDATQDDGSCAGDLLCIENPEPIEGCEIENNFNHNLPCYDLDGDGTTDIGVGLVTTLEGGYWGETSAFIKQITSSSSFPIVVTESDLQENREGFQLECGNCSVVVVFLMENGKTGYVTASADGTVTNLGMTNADEITFTGLNECPTTCAVSIADIELTNPQCTDELGSVSITASCEDCTNDLEYKLNDGDWQSGTSFADLMPGEYDVTVREAVDGATECEATQSITITEPTDTQAPNVNCPTETIEVTLDSETGVFEITEAIIVAALSGVSDNCSEFEQLDYESSETMFSCDDIGSQEIQFMVTDEANNTATCDVTVMVGVPGSTISIADAELVEGNVGNTDMIFTVSRTSAACEASVEWGTSDYSAIAGSDYVGVSTPQTLTFATGELSKEIMISIIGDLELEENEMFNVTLSNAVGEGTTIDDDSAVGTILNDEITPNYIVNFVEYETLQDAIDALEGEEGIIFLLVDNYEDSSVTTIPSNVTLVVNQDKTLTFTNDITVAGEIGSRGTIVGNLTINGKYYGGGSIDGNLTNNGVFMIGGSLPDQVALQTAKSTSN